jgi:uncharacterized linocin/CFP29 family protein
MNDRNAQVGWTDAQWNRVREEVLREWQKVRVAGSFLPIYGPLPPSTHVVPSEVIGRGGTVDDGEISRIYELTVRVELSRQQVAEEDLSGALLLLRRAATALAIEEDDVVFNGQTAQQPSLRPRVPGRVRRFPEVQRIDGEPPTAIHALEDSHLDTPSNPGPLGLVRGAFEHVDLEPDSGPELLTAISDAISVLEANGYGPPFVCVLGRAAFRAAHDPMGDSMVLPADRIEPLIGRQLLRASVLDYLEDTQIAGVVLSLAGDSMDLVVAVEATPEFTQVDTEGHYVFRVFERLALRIKDNYAIVRLEYEAPAARTVAVEVQSAQQAEGIDESGA